jgi:hypothetical protein
MVGGLLFGRSRVLPRYRPTRLRRAPAPARTNALVAGECVEGESRHWHACLRYDTGKWTVREVVGHLSDDERLLSYRAIRISHDDQAVLSGFDEKAYVPATAFESRSLASVLRDYPPLVELMTPKG